MSWKSLGRLFSGIRGAYNDINPATLTGAIDVIVVEQKDGTFTCGPFHVRFGKLTAFSPVDKTVELYVNGEFVEFLRMRLGSAGNAYFVDSSETVTGVDYADSANCQVFTRDDTWSSVTNMRRRRKVRRDSAMSEPDGPSLLDDSIHHSTDNDYFEVSSDCEAQQEDSNPGLRTCFSNYYASDSQISDSSKAIVHNLQWEWQDPDYLKEQDFHYSKMHVPSVNKTTDNSSDNSNQTLSKTKVRDVKGLYLEDLVTSEVDQNVKEAYIYPPCHTSLSCQQSCKYSTSQTAVDGSCTDYGYRSDNELSPRSVSPIHPHVYNLRLSLCGGLSAYKTPSEEKFFEHLVSYEEFIQDPNAILSNPNLVIFLNDRYCSWQMAAPSVISLLAFQTELPYLTLRRLESLYMPKTQSRRTSWFSWGASQQQNVPIVEPLTPTKESENQDSHLNTDVSNSCKTSQFIQESSEPIGVKANRLSSNEIIKLKLKPGRNDVEFRVTTKYQGTCTCSASIYYWRWCDRIVVSDVDGTITRSDLLGHLLPMLGHDWTHAGVARLYNHIANNGYRFLYLSARALGQAGITRSYLRQVVQDSSLKLPDGPMLLSPNSLLHAFHQEVIINKPEDFKIQCLKEVCSLFPGSSPLYAGFGNKVNDVCAYQTAGIERCRIFTIKPSGEVHNEYHHIRSTTYKELGDLADHYFPPLRSLKEADIDNNLSLDGQYENEELSLGSSNQRRPSVFQLDSIQADVSKFSSFTFWRTYNYELSFPPPEPLKNSESSDT